MQRWTHKMDTYLAELLRLEGRGTYTDCNCPSCAVRLAAYRCADCLGGVLRCADCTVSLHCATPLHRIHVGPHFIFPTSVC